jgi:hypothetical protein
VFLRHLQERYNTPSEEWRTTVQDTFTELCKILGHREAVPILGREETPEVISARTARDHALPSITVLPTGTHALRLTATNEPLDCICFGTMSPKTYVAVFWELVVEVQRSGNYTLIIHEVDAGPVPRFLLSFESLLFEVRYYHCNALVRK